MEDIDITLITKRSIHGVFALISRTFFITAVNVVVNFLLTIILSPAVFGVFFVVSAAVDFLAYFSDIGLAAALIQKKESITQDDLKTTFTIQQILVLIVVTIALLLSQFIGSFYHLDRQGIFLFEALVIAFFFSSLKTIPSIILERHLFFGKIIIPEIVETIVFNTVVLVLALKGFGIASFTFAVLARSIVGVITIYTIQPWKIQLSFSKSVAKRLLSFGIPFQTNSFLALLKDDLVIAYLGKVLPLAQVGYIGFAQKWALMPLQLIMSNVIRITFPSYARLQHDKAVLGKAIEKSLFGITIVIFPVLTGLVILSPSFVHVIPKYTKWEPALLSLGFFALNGAMSSISTPLTNALNAIGKIKISLYLMIFWTIATWITTPLLIHFIGFNGVAIASAAVATSVIGVVYIAKRELPFTIFSVLKVPLFASVLMGLLLYGIDRIVPSNYVTLLSQVVIGTLVYVSVSFLMAKEQILADLRVIRENIKR